MRMSYCSTGIMTTCYNIFRRLVLAMTALTIAAQACDVSHNQELTTAKAKMYDAIAKVTVKKLYSTTSVLVKVQKMFLGDIFYLGKLINVTVSDGCGMSLVDGGKFILFLDIIDGINTTEFQMSSAPRLATKESLRYVRHVIAELNAVITTPEPYVATTNPTTANTDTLGLLYTRCEVDGYCLNGGTCFQLDTSETFCHCPSDHGGPRCDLYDNVNIFFGDSTSNDDQYPDMTETILALVCILLTALIIIVIGVLIFVRYRNAMERERVKQNTNESLSNLKGPHEEETTRMIGNTQTMSAIESEL